MKFLFLTALAVVYVGTTLEGTTVCSVQASVDFHFICAAGFDQQTNQRFPTTYVLTPTGGKYAVIQWRFSWFNNIGYSPQQRCQEVSARFQTAYNNGSFRFITNSQINGQPVICTSRQNGGACDTTLLTLRPSDDPLEILTTLKDLLGGRATAPIEHSSDHHQVYYQVNLNQLLQTARTESEK